MLAALAPPRRCPLCGGPVPELLSPSGRRRRGRPRVYCSERCRIGDRVSRPAPGPEQAAAFAAAVRDAVSARGLPLRELAAELAAAYPTLASSVATLGAWQSGSSAPPRTVHGRDRVLALERVLRRPAGDLALRMPGGAIVPTPRPSGDTGLAARRARLDHLVGTLEGPQQVLPVAVTQEICLGPPLTVRTTLLVRAAHDGVDRYWYVDGADPGRRPVLGETAGCRAVRRVPEPGTRGTGLIAVELVLDRPLPRGRLHELSFTVRYGGDPGPGYRYDVDRPLERLDLTLRVDPRHQPDAVLACRWHPRGRTETERRAITVPGATAYRMALADPAPGAHGWRWTPAGLRSSAA